MFTIIFWITILLNYAAINYCVLSGLGFADISYRFQERQMITFLSSAQLLLTAFSALFIYTFGKMIYKKDIARLRLIKVWLISAAFFTLGAMDEYFMLHEGIDGNIAAKFFGITENPHLDGLTLGLYGVLALILFFKFKEEILRYKDAFLLFCVGGFFFLLSITLDIKSVEPFCIVLEETSKLIAVVFLFLGHISILIENLKKVKSLLPS